MSEINLLMFGCAVTFIAVGGAYTYLRERYLETEIPKRSTREDRKPGGKPSLRDAA